MSAKHTPGPWMVAAGPSSIVGWPVVGSGGRAIASLTWWPREHFQPAVTDEAYDALVAEIGANGRLIAAAPNMAGLIARLLEWEDSDASIGMNRSGGFDALITDARAISKALGPDQ